MVLRRYSPEILKMIYYLSISEKRLYGKELEDYLTSKVGDVSPRTVHRWLKFIKNLNKNEETFNYYPSINFSSFGLKKVEVVIKKPRDWRILDLIPHTYWSSTLRDHDFNENLIIHYLVPPEKVPNIKEILSLVKNKGVIKDYH